MSASPLKQRFVLDTSVFVTDEIRRDGEDLAAAVDRLLDLVAAARLELGISCYIPPSVHDELTGMLRARDVPDGTFSKINTWVIRKHPDRYGVTVPAEVVYRFVDEMSDRVDRGLRVSEAAVRRTEEIDGNGDGPMSPADEVVSELRDEYRSTLRQGVLDSREDFDLLVLAREMDAGVVTEDTGILGWAEDFGLRYMRGRDFPALVEEYLRATGERDGATGDADRPPRVDPE